MADTLTNISYQAASESAKQQMAFQERMSNTAHQREVKDLIAAGLNPVLSANAGSSSPVGAEGYVTSAKAKQFDEQLAAYELEQKKLDHEHELDMLQAETDAKLLINSAKIQAQSVNAISKALSSYSSGKGSGSRSGSKKSSYTNSKSNTHLNFSTGDSNTDYWVEKVLNKNPVAAAALSWITGNDNLQKAAHVVHKVLFGDGSTPKKLIGGSAKAGTGFGHKNSNQPIISRGNGRNTSSNPIHNAKKNLNTLVYADKVNYSAAKHLLYR